MPKRKAPAAMLFGSSDSKRSAAAIGDIASRKLEQRLTFYFALSTLNLKFGTGTGL
jgi:hypothetical protein